MRKSAAARKAIARMDAFRRGQVPPPLKRETSSPHGTDSRYAGATRCRCELCVAAHSEVDRRYRELREKRLRRIWLL